VNDHTAGPAVAEDWNQYEYPDQGVAIQFPVKPEATKSTYDSIYLKGLPSFVVSAEDDQVIYKLTVVDLSTRSENELPFAGGRDPLASRNGRGMAKHGHDVTFSHNQGQTRPLTTVELIGGAAATSSRAIPFRCRHPSCMLRTGDRSNPRVANPTCQLLSSATAPVVRAAKRDHREKLSWRVIERPVPWLWRRC
jgi:hypothetical protein